MGYLDIRVLCRRAEERFLSLIQSHTACATIQAPAPSSRRGASSGTVPFDSMASTDPTRTPLVYTASSDRTAPDLDRATWRGTTLNGAAPNNLAEAAKLQVTAQQQQRQHGDGKGSGDAVVTSVTNSGLSWP